MISSYRAALAAFLNEHSKGWASLTFFQDGSAQELAARLDSMTEAGVIVLPAPRDVFNALRWAPLRNARVVILGQDPYPTPGDAHGLAFSASKGVAIPRSLRNIFKEMLSDLGLAMPEHGCLESWAKQGVLLLNTCLTVEAGLAGSHRRFGWEALTDQMIGAVSSTNASAVFLLWGADAHRKAELIDHEKHLVLKTAHPSPLSARRGFFNSRPFSTANAWLKARNQREIDWHVS